MKHLFEGKCGIKQESFDFEAPEESDITGESIVEKPKKRGRKSKKEQMNEAAEEVPAFDPYA